jgi:hypothetical protein
LIAEVLATTAVGELPKVVDLTRITAGQAAHLAQNKPKAAIAVIAGEINAFGRRKRTSSLREHADPDAPPKVSVSVTAPRSCEWGKGRRRDATSARRSERPRNNRFDVDISIVAQSNGDGHRLRRAPRRAQGEGPYFERSLVDPLLDRSGGRQ